MVNRTRYILLSALLFLSTQAFAVTISMNEVALDAIDPLFNGALRAQQLEDELNSRIFSSFDMELEVAAPTGGNTAVDDLSFEGPGLTVIGGSGFILRWATPVEQVRIGFGDFKDNGDRTVRAYDILVDYVRDPTQTSQSANGLVTSNPPAASAIDLATGTVTAGSSLDLIVGGLGIAPISSVFVQTNFFLTSWLDIEFTPTSAPPPSAVPLPATAWLFLSAMAGLFGMRRFRTQS